MLVIKTKKQIVDQIVKCSVLLAELTDRVVDPNDDIINSAIAYNKRNNKRLQKLLKEYLPTPNNENSDVSFYVLAWAKDMLKGASQEDFIEFFGCLIHGFVNTGVPIAMMKQVAERGGVPQLIGNLSMSEKKLWIKLYNHWFDINFMPQVMKWED